MHASCKHNSSFPLPEILSRLLGKCHFTALQDYPSGRRLYFVDFGFEVPPLCLCAKPIMSDLQLLKPTSGLPNQSQQNVVAEPTGHPVNVRVRSPLFARIVCSVSSRTFCFLTFAALHSLTVPVVELICPARVCRRKGPRSSSGDCRP